ncbi:1-phosphofructokinase family hexose kinase [Thermophilibacter immobilis]|uniref:1-phosphofructokinase family hexose kinase n=1 Tax=Thermophilibacter immobilis TaxID=2779519 RepID=A0A7S7RV57_9ACTN|nr:1-phosphofructokinase family hexose kinase [Thermophilibacter immobilis]QOY60964.1 1-phosphofructokinase family hexose kinase [Thermophilibacter immobilis]
MIYTLTTNPAIDLNVTTGTLSTDRVNRTRDAVYTPNGKGLNVSFALGHYGVDSQILGFFGGFSGDYIVREAARRCPVRPVTIDGITRVNVFVTTPEGEYKLPNAGAAVCREKQVEMLDLLREAGDLSCLVVSGSLPPGVDAGYYDELVDVVRARGAELVLDISHPHLAELVARRPLLIKPNDEEVAAIFGVDVGDEGGALAALSELHRRGAQNVLLTLGGEGAYFSDGAHVWHASAAKVKVLSTACAGDATLASFLSVWLEDRGAVERALIRAMATGANVAMSAGLGDFSLVDDLARQVEVTRLV